MAADFASRVVRLGDVLSQGAVNVFFGHKPVTMGYLHGLTEHAGERFMALCVSARGDLCLIAPALSETQARRCGIADVRVWRDAEDPLELLTQLAAEWGFSSGVLAVDDDMPAKMLLEMQACLPTARFIAGSKLFSSLTRRKDEEELDFLLQAGKIADDSFKQVFPQFAPE